MRLDYAKVAPGGVKAFGAVYGYIQQSGLDDSLVELVYLRVSQINGCAYCLDMHSRDLAKKGISLQKLALVQAWGEAGELYDKTDLSQEATQAHLDTVKPSAD